MKRLILLAAALILPFASVDAASKGFKPGTTFKLKVAKVKSTTQTGYFGQEVKARVPKGIPKFKKGSRISFKVVRKGKLTGKGFKIDFAHASKTVVEYNSFDQGEVNFSQTAEILRKGKRRAKRGFLIFTITDFRSGQPVIRTVVYTLK